MRRLDETVLVRPIFFELGLEQLLFVVCDGFLVQDQYLGYVVLVCLSNHGQHYIRTDFFTLCVS